MPEGEVKIRMQKKARSIWWKNERDDKGIKVRERFNNIYRDFVNAYLYGGWDKKHKHKKGRKKLINK